MSGEAFTLDLLNQIATVANQARSLRDYVQRVVERVAAVMNVPVCSLYLRQPDDSMRLIASVGLAPRAIDAATLPANRGLVGAVAQARAPVNVAEGHLHPAFVYLPETDEQPNDAFMGVPLVHLGNLVGVLVVQDDRDGPFSSAEESFLVTVAAQLAGGLAHWRDHAEANVDPMSDQRTLHGVAAAPGVATGTAHLVLSASTMAALDDPPSRGVEVELAALEEAVGATVAELDAAADQFRGTVADDLVELYDFYRSVVAGDELLETCRRRIREGASAFTAVRSTTADISHAFEKLEDAYLRSRAEDLVHLGTKLLGNLSSTLVEPAPTAPSLVLIGSLIGITDIARFDVGQVTGIVDTEGSGFSHTAILARALGIPAVMDIGHLEHVNEGDEVVVDADTGIAIFRPEPAVRRAYRQRIAAQAELQDELAALRDLPAVTTDGVRVRLLVNTGLLADAEPGLRRGAEGVGLYRSEIPFLMHETFPTEEEQRAIYRQVLEVYHPLPVTMRLLDVGGDKALPYLPLREDNPLLGWRGIRFALDNPAVLFTQMRAMLAASAGLDNLEVMIPMVTRLAEVEQVADMLEAARSRLEDQGVITARPRLGIMVEVPAVVPLLPHLAPLIDFVAIGTNDLTQYLLGVDRGNARVAAHFDHLHPAVIRQIKDVVDVADALGLDSRVCGEMAADPAAVPLLLGLGLRSLSMNAHALPLIKRLIRETSMQRARKTAARAAELSDERAIRALLQC